jgi:hypothetical protein
MLESAILLSGLIEHATETLGLAALRLDFCLELLSLVAQLVGIPFELLKPVLPLRFAGSVYRMGEDNPERQALHAPSLLPGPFARVDVVGG